MALIDLVGIVAGLLTTFCVVPEIIKVYKLKETRDLSLAMYILLCLGLATWLIYGIAINNIPIIIANILGLLFNGTLLFFKIKWG